MFHSMKNMKSLKKKRNDMEVEWMDGFGNGEEE